MEKSWKQLIKEGATAKEIVRTQKPMNINSWIEKCNKEELSDDEQDIIIHCADHLNFITFEILTPREYAKQWRKTINI